jgi:hypothetical protein
MVRSTSFFLVGGGGELRLARRTTLLPVGGGDGPRLTRRTTLLPVGGGGLGMARKATFFPGFVASPRLTRGGCEFAEDEAIVGLAETEAVRSPPNITTPHFDSTQTPHGRGHTRQVSRFSRRSLRLPEVAVGGS